MGPRDAARSMEVENRDAPAEHRPADPVGHPTQMSDANYRARAEVQTQQSLLTAHDAGLHSSWAAAAVVDLITPPTSPIRDGAAFATRHTLPAVAGAVAVQTECSTAAQAGAELHSDAELHSAVPNGFSPPRTERVTSGLSWAEVRPCGGDTAPATRTECSTAPTCECSTAAQQLGKRSPRKRASFAMHCDEPPAKRQCTRADMGRGYGGIFDCVWYSV